MPKISTYSDGGVPVGADYLLGNDASAGPGTKRFTVTNLGAGVVALNTATAGSACDASAGTVGASTLVARADHTHPISSGTVGKSTPQASDGSATDFALSDHGHPLVSPEKDSGTNRTLDADDHATLIACDNASGMTISVPDGLAVGYRVEFVQRHASATITLAAVASVTFLVPPGASATPTTGGQYARMVMTIIETDTALVHGVLA